MMNPDKIYGNQSIDGIYIDLFSCPWNPLTGGIIELDGEQMIYSTQ
jgi:hypothetical protein